MLKKRKNSYYNKINFNNHNNNKNSNVLISKLIKNLSYEQDKFLQDKYNINRLTYNFKYDNIIIILKRIEKFFNSISINKNYIYNFYLNKVIDKKLVNLVFYLFCFFNKYSKFIINDNMIKLIKFSNKDLLFNKYNNNFIIKNFFYNLNFELNNSYLFKNNVFENKKKIIKFK